MLAQHRHAREGASSGPPVRFEQARFGEVERMTTIGGFLRLAICGMLLSALAGCVLAPGDPRLGNTPGGVEQGDADLSTRITRLRITPALVAAYDRKRLATRPMTRAQREALDNYEYRVGPGDILSVIVYDHPELTIPAGADRSAAEAGQLVRKDGTIFYPFVGQVPVAGRTMEEIRQILSVELGEYLSDPQIDVLIAQYGSQRIYVTGAVREPTIVPITEIPLTVLDAVTAAGIGAQGFGSGNNTGSPNFHEATLLRNGALIPLSLYDLLWEGDMSQNYLLQDDDVINVPRDLNQVVAVLGQVNQPTTFTMGAERFSLTDAISRAGGLDDASAQPSGVFVLRPERPMSRSGDSESAVAGERVATVYQLDLRLATGLMLAARFPLEPHDVVYVTTAPMERWNRVIDLLTPSLDFPGDVRGSRDDIDDLF